MIGQQEAQHPSHGYTQAKFFTCTSPPTPEEGGCQDGGRIGEGEVTRLDQPPVYMEKGRGLLAILRDSELVHVHTSS